MEPSPVASRGRCPICRTALAAVSSEPIAEERCPRCEAALWALTFPSGAIFFVRRPGHSAAEFIFVLAGARLGASEADVSSFLRRADLLDMVEFMMELEAGLELPR
jgi:hypothetical protein